MIKRSKNHIVVFEHEKLLLRDGLDEKKLLALQRYYGSEGVPYYTLIHNGVKFGNFVGVLQVGNLVIEVLPKADNYVENDDDKWRSILIDIVRTVHNFDIEPTSQSHLKVKPNTILDLYIEMFIREVESLIRHGLIKQYRTYTGNASALKGNLNFSRQIQENLIHQERFYVSHTVYDTSHQLHFILYQTILLIKKVNVNIRLTSRICTLLLDFPEMPYHKITKDSFKQIVYNRKNEVYRRAIEISKFLLLQYHPDVKKGNNHVLALMFDMNKLWEQFIYISLKKYLKKNGVDIKVKGQVLANFWEHERGSITRVKPDIFIKIGEKHFVIDTKWKNLGNNNPSIEDLRQMYVYHEYFSADKVALIYPSDSSNINVKGIFSRKKYIEDNTLKECSILPIPVLKDIREWQKDICSNILQWVE